MEAMEAMETLETSYLDENNLYVVEFSRNSLLPNDIDDEQNDNNIIEEIKIIVKNTNIYAYAKKAGEGRKWKDLTIEEFQIWLAIVIYAGIFKLPSIRDYWNKDSKFPEHKIARYMTLLRFEQVLLI